MFMRPPGTFEKSFNRSDKTKHVNKCGKNANKSFFKPLFGALPKIKTGSENICRFIMDSSFQKWS